MKFHLKGYKRALSGDGQFVRTHQKSIFSKLQQQILLDGELLGKGRCMNDNHRDSGNKNK